MFTAAYYKMFEILAVAGLSGSTVAVLLVAALVSFLFLRTGHNPERVEATGACMSCFSTPSRLPLCHVLESYWNVMPCCRKVV